MADNMDFLEEFDYVELSTLNTEVSPIKQKAESGSTVQTPRQVNNNTTQTSPANNTINNSEVPSTASNTDTADISTVNEKIFDFCVNSYNRIVSSCKLMTHNVVDSVNDRQNHKMFNKGKLVICGDFKFLMAQDQLMLYRYTGIDNIVIVPDCVGNLPVTFISPNAFKKGRFKSATLLKNITASIRQKDIAIKTIDNIRSASYGITNIQLPNTLLHIPPYLFEHCPNLEQIEIPESVIKISANAFEGARLKRIYFSNACVADMRYVEINSNCSVYVKKENLESYKRGLRVE